LEERERLLASKQAARKEAEISLQRLQELRRRQEMKVAVLKGNESKRAQKAASIATFILLRPLNVNLEAMVIERTKVLTQVKSG
jgi:hypothetical protein